MMLDVDEPKLALVVDDSAMQCKVLRVLLEEESYQVICANDGASGVAMYIKHQPDLVLMDINMPIMNGYQAAREIKSLSNDNLAPLIFVTSMNTDQAFIESIDAGGDGILVRPFSPKVFKAKIKAIQRISDLYSQVKKLQQEQQNDAELAEQLMSGVIEARNYALDKIGILKKPATLFSGDIQLSAISPNGDIHVMLGDFTGHGLRASIGAIPLSETFRTMTKKGFSLLEIIVQINQQLYQLLPSDLFLAAGFVSISPNKESIYAFNAGLPESYIFDDNAAIKYKILSSHPPIGVLPDLLPGTKLIIKSINKNDRVILISDGIVEARNESGDMFGFERFECSAQQGIKDGKLIETVIKTLDSFCQNTPQDDDISLIDIPCGGWENTDDLGIASVANLYDATDTHTGNIQPCWTWDLLLTGKRLASVNPIPMVMNQLQSIEGAGEHWQSLYTILTELYINALDHGVLELGSELKSSPEGFVEYYNEREKRLNCLNSGHVGISLHYHSLERGGKVVIVISDSGKSFDYAQFIKKEASKSESELALCGRGIALISQLCDTLEYDENSSRVKATYIWLKG